MHASFLRVGVEEPGRRIDAKDLYCFVIIYVWKIPHNMCFLILGIR